MTKHTPTLRMLAPVSSTAAAESPPAGCESSPKTQILYLPQLVEPPDKTTEPPAPAAAASPAPDAIGTRSRPGPFEVGKTQILSLRAVQSAALRTQVFGTVPEPSGSAPESVSGPPARATSTATGEVTRFLPVEELLSRAVSLRDESAPRAKTERLSQTETERPRVARSPSRSPAIVLQTLWRHWRSTSVVHRASAVVALLLVAVVVTGAARKSRRSAAPSPSAAVRLAPPSAAVPAPVLPSTSQPAAERARQPLPVGLEGRAAGAVAEGRTDVALELYRELANAAPERRVYAEAVRILERRTRTPEEP